jgi:hypothetical protein
VANLTIVVEDDVLRRARIRALEQGTSVNALLRWYLQSYVDADAESRQAMTRFLERARQATSGSGPAGRAWTREELHDRQALR